MTGGCWNSWLLGAGFGVLVGACAVYMAPKNAIYIEVPKVVKTDCMITKAEKRAIVEEALVLVIESGYLHSKTPLPERKPNNLIRPK